MSGIRVSILNDLSAMGAGPQNMAPCTSCKKLKRACIDDGPKPNGSCEHCRRTNRWCSYSDRPKSEVLFVVSNNIFLLP
ncbi:hypothetical protein SCHPADRAFT_266690 [Schizopora paradoxa]|uniref:Zn(2)-C6 fungal-type domain-containing protein n=1 Tax=Schizopora paradoxa TaxID=27342 RepID=A0A0H2RV19_9AGAM|nr:hypothetical protein SCHPADRAFT_266690 [Schizopora paradoxa]